VSTLRYLNAPFSLTPDALRKLHAKTHLGPDGQVQTLEIDGFCPRCQHAVHYYLNQRAFGLVATDGGGGGAGLADREEILITLPVGAEAQEAVRAGCTFALHCNCAESHPKGKGGCGAWLSLGATWEADGSRPELTAGPALSLLEEHAAEARDKLADSELDRVRAAAGNWKTGLGALFALIPTLVVVKGTDTVDKLSSGDKTVVGVLIAVGTVLAVIATLLALRAAFGPLRRTATPGDDLTAARESEVDRTIGDLRLTRKLSVLGVAALAAAIAYAWAAPTAPAPAYFSVGLSNGASVCGTLAGADQAAVRVQTANGETIAFSLADVKSTTFVASC